MVVITLGSCPARLRGDLTKWMMEIRTGVYVGEMSARVRDALWKRICENVAQGSASMVYSDQNEQGFSIRVHNSEWEPVDFDGITLMRKPAPLSKEPPQWQGSPSKMQAIEGQLPANGPHTAGVRAETQSGIAESACAAAEDRTRLSLHALDSHPMHPSATVPANPGTSIDKCHLAPESYSVIDLETTGLSGIHDAIIELGALRVRNRQIVQEFHCLVRTERELPEAVVQLTGIDTAMLQREGLPLAAAISGFLEFVGGDALVCHYAPFDMAFLREACQRISIPWKHRKIFDTRAIAKETAIPVANYKLLTLAQHFGIAEHQVHRALADCLLIHQVFLKLNEIPVLRSQNA